ncbi:hypothetical protein TSAR_011612 [Trichomalopsis sarcophagae]|uniref:Uncharacterized protein n=1 Tax=Trichomalopsis sarcophagae TaxID=543379 RepID=A0A232FAN6_9HYME|nr:hypothetical protein TSAR_011612 [Trichomalopsis sarcophagae]
MDVRGASSRQDFSGADRPGCAEWARASFFDIAAIGRIMSMYIYLNLILIVKSFDCSRSEYITSVLIN